MNKLAVNGSFLVKSVTGVQRYARELIKALSEIGFKNLIILAPKSIQKSSIYGYPILRDSISWRSYYGLWEQLRLPFLMKQANASYLWSPSNLGPIAVNKHIVTLHDAAVFAGPEWFSWKFVMFYRFFLPRIGKRAKMILTVSNFSRDELIKYGIASSEKLKVIHNGIDHVNISTCTGAGEKEKFVLAVGSRDPRKNITRVIEAWTHIPPNVKEGRILFVVGGSFRAFADEKIVGIPEDVKQLGYVDDKKLFGLYKSAEFFIYPSLYEGFGLPPLEAMKANLPVLVSKIGPLVEICGNAALYCDPYSVEDIKSKIEMLLKDVNLRNILSTRGKEVAQRFTWTKAAMQFADAYHRLIQNDLQERAEK